jgi:hypothetical protein
VQGDARCKTSLYSWFLAAMAAVAVALIIVIYVAGHIQMLP